jgi:hypothetical protein
MVYSRVKQLDSTEKEGLGEAMVEAVLERRIAV